MFTILRKSFFKKTINIKSIIKFSEKYEKQDHNMKAKLSKSLNSCRLYSFSNTFKAKLQFIFVLQKFEIF